MQLTLISSLRPLQTELQLGYTSCSAWEEWIWSGRSTIVLDKICAHHFVHASAELWSSSFANAQPRFSDSVIENNLIIIICTNWWTLTIRHQARRLFILLFYKFPGPKYSCFCTTHSMSYLLNCKPFTMNSGWLTHHSLNLLNHHAAVTGGPQSTQPQACKKVFRRNLNT